MKEKTKANFILDKPWMNIIGVFLIAGLLWIPYIKSEVLASAGMAAIILNWMPFLIAIVTIIFYLISRLFTRKRNWIISLLGTIMNIIFVLSAF